jgi:nucleoid-associated protein YgaU
LEGGCAFRVLRAATKLRERGHDADEAYRVARELAPYELFPSPTWEVMCSELEWPV